MHKPDRAEKASAVNRAAQRPGEKPGGGWAAAALVRGVYERFLAGWKALPADVRRGWLRGVGAGFLGVALFTVGLTFIGRSLEAAGWFAWEPGFMQWLQDSTPFNFNLATWIQVHGNTLVALPVALFAAGWTAWKRRSIRALSMIGGFALYKLFVLLAWKLWPRARPDIILDGLAVPEGFSSYPSGHAVQAAFVYGMLAYWWGSATRNPVERGVAVLFALLMFAASGIGRLGVGAHWPSDILAGGVLGGVWLGVLIFLGRAAERKTARADR